MVVQSVVIPKKNFTLAKAKQWIKDNKYKVSFFGKGVDKTVNTYRFRQVAPSVIKPKTYRMKNIKDGIKLVVGNIKK
jgi:hypothetical protein